MEPMQLYILLLCFLGVVVVIGIIWWRRAWLVALNMLDWLHWVSFGIGTGQMILILTYYIPLMQWHIGGGRDSHRNTFISDFLFADMVFRAVMTCFVALQLGVCAVFVSRLRARHEDGPFMSCVEMVLFVCAWIGWTTLCAQYSNPSGEGMSIVHAAGVAVFIACSLVYVLMMSCNIFLLFSELSSFALAEFLLLAFCLFASIGCGVHFICRALQGDPDAWITEHLAFLFFVACHMLLFLIDYGHHRDSIASSSSSAEHLVTIIPPVGCGYFDGVRIQPYILKEDLRRIR
jgi:hypothetical protein